MMTINSDIYSHDSHNFSSDCPTGDDPRTVGVDETNCTGVIAEGGRGVGRPGNICHVDCSNRGTCKDGLCKCFKGFYGVNCGKRTTRY